MSRDQKPARPVMIAPDSTNGASRRRVTGEVAASAGTPPAVSIAPVKSRTLLLSVVFLLACVAGAAGIALAPWLLSGR